MKACTRVLALGHEATLSGAPMVQLGWLRWAAARPERLRARAILARPGELLRQWPTAVPRTVLARLDPHGAALARFLGPRLVDRYFFLRRRLARAAAREAALGWDVLWMSTLTLGWMLDAFEGGDRPVVVHAHELRRSVARFTTPADLARLLRSRARFVAVSAAVRSFLVGELGLTADRVHLVRNPLPPRPEPAPVRDEARSAVRRRLGLAPDAGLVVAVGNLDPVKAPELFLEVAARVRADGGRAPTFCWAGGGQRSAYGRDLVARGEREPNVRFLDRTDDPRPLLAAADLVLIPSLEESASLVALEAAAAGTPVAAFADSGGVSDLLAGGAGWLVAERDAEAMTEAVRECFLGPAEAAARARRAADWVREHADYEMQCAALAEIFEEACRS